MASFLIMTVLVIAGVLFLIQYSKNNVAREQEQLLEEQRCIAESERERKDFDLEQINRQLKMAEALHQAKLVGSQDDVDKITNLQYDGPLPDESNGLWTSIYPDRLMILSIAGINYREGIDRYIGAFNGVLVPEPDNDYDPNAIMVKCEDGHHLGYVPEDMTGSVRKMLGVNFERHRITGTISECEDDDDGRKFYAGSIYITK